MSSDESDLTPESIKLDTLGIVNNLLPEKSKEKYLSLRRFPQMENCKRRIVCVGVSASCLFRVFIVYKEVQQPVVSSLGFYYLAKEKYPQIKKLFGHDPLFKWVVTAMVLTQFAMLPIVQHLSWPVAMLLAYCFGGVINHSLMLEKYPQIKKLFGHDPLFKWVVTAMVLTQFAMLPIVQHLSWPVAMLLAYCFGGVINHSLMLALHEISHNLAFGHCRPLHNRLFGFFANLPIGIPASVTFRKYHLEHHKHQGDEVVDPDVPTLLEAKLFCTTGGKLLWLLLLPVLYSLRPMVVRPMPPTPLEVVNLVIQLFFDATVVKLFGWKVLAYLVFGSLMSMGLHPASAHFIFEHYMFRKGFETYSYYGPWNWIMFNAGYHNEHHDFPAVPAWRLPEVKRIAAEFYEDLPQHNSWPAVLYHFVMDPDIGPYARIKRKHYGLND